MLQRETRIDPPPAHDRGVSINIRQTDISEMCPAARPDSLHTSHILPNIDMIDIRSSPLMWVLILKRGSVRPGRARGVASADNFQTWIASMTPYDLQLRTCGSLDLSAYGMGLQFSL